MSITWFDFLNQELDLPFREGCYEQGKGGWSGSTVNSDTVAGQHRTFKQTQT
jgi:hypothetical protein